MEKDYRKIVGKLGVEIIKISPERTTINPLEIAPIDEDKNRVFFSYSLQNMYEFIELHILGCNLTKCEKDELYRLFMKNNNTNHQMEFEDIYRVLLELKYKKNKKLLRLINAFENFLN
ncbi:hypothetical protein J0795_29580 [Bacillus paranthracis]|uniref:hypothetical protein n=1 Tax=Bacillus paranthracis TaxID=2026186 RepID=UPI002FDBEEBF